MVWPHFFYNVLIYIYIAGCLLQMMCRLNSCYASAEGIIALLRKINVKKGLLNVPLYL